MKIGKPRKKGRKWFAWRPIFDSRTKKRLWLETVVRKTHYLSPDTYHSILKEN